MQYEPRLSDSDRCPLPSGGSRDETALHLAAGCTEGAHSVRALLKSGASVHSTDNTGLLCGDDELSCDGQASRIPLPCVKFMLPLFKTIR